MELVGGRYRPALGTALQIGFSVSFMLQAAIAYRLRDEFWYQVASSSPNFFILLLIMYVHDLHVLSLCSWCCAAVALTNYRSPHFDVASTCLLLIYSFQFTHAFHTIHAFVSSCTKDGISALKA